MSVLLVVLSVLTLYPLATLVYGSLHTTPPGVAGEFTLDGYRAVVSARNFRILLDTLGIAFLKTIIAVGLAVLFAWIVARTDTPGRGTLEVLITLPFFIPPILTATAWRHARQSAGRHHQPGLALDDRHKRHRHQRLFLRRRHLAHDAVFDAVHLPVHRRCLPRHGSVA